MFYDRKLAAGVLAPELEVTTPRPPSQTEVPSPGRTTMRSVLKADLLSAVNQAMVAS
jgi:hypothetical protein